MSNGDGARTVWEQTNVGRVVEAPAYVIAHPLLEQRKKTLRNGCMCAVCLGRRYLIIFHLMHM